MILRDKNVFQLKNIISPSYRFGRALKTLIDKKESNKLSIYA